MSQPTEAETARPPSVARTLWAHLRLGVPFYLGLHAPGARRVYPGCHVRAAAGYTPELVRALLALYRGEETGAGRVDTINFRCAVVTSADGGERFFFKEFPRHHPLHDLERLVRCSRVDRAWRAAHLLPRLGILTPRAVGTAQDRAGNGRPVEYLATQWLDAGVPFPERLKLCGADVAARSALLREFAQNLRRWHGRGLYLRDLVKNVLLREEGEAFSYWLTDLDGLHPCRVVNRRRLLHQMRQLAYWAAPLDPHEAAAVVQGYLGTEEGPLAKEIFAALLAPPLDATSIGHQDDPC